MTEQAPARPTTLITEDLLLLLFQPDSSTIAGENTLFYVLAGGVLADLAQMGAIEVDPGKLGGAVVRAVPGAAPGDPMLRDTWEFVSEKPRGAQTVLAAMGPHLREPLLQRLVQRGDIRREQTKFLGVIPTSRLAPGDLSRRTELIERVRAVLVDGEKPDLRTAALVALISASGTLSWFHREIPWTSPVITRAKELERGEWGADAAAQAVARTMAAVVVNTVIVTLAVAPRA